MKKIDYYIPLYKNKLYHFYNRSNGKEKIFFKEENFFYFLRQYDKYLSDCIDTFAYCLLPNHFHFLGRIKTGDPDFVSENFRKFFISYSISINVQEKRKGNLFQRGFKRKIIENEKYFYSAVYYIHANPIHHRLIKDLTQYKFSSFNTLCSDNTTKLCRNEVIDWFEEEIIF
jgi:REP element-mobilizing transposase RayT